ncbi:CRISPR-associated protein Csm2 [Bisgaardia hudsonensis]|uniref:CRISPR system Cms protein Csm2 n=1 Tax=Bisgaardia hudsonensis TaxID=109472 RepID=A0A4R2N139_9PAST|nr:type III-A CRISPR-associated protein Csm2 [Bisgaardia hudsonensis]QLB13185.1 type III-A CRISPR-associated protein Csm2 [Bisgaardia hudsonensis]TCP13240.1 CRISPR-associated protein Csm2 [Bisgaardia hudsonensis]
MYNIIEKIKFGSNKSENIFSDIAEKSAEKIKMRKGKYNKTTQLRKFYDELSMWNEKVQQSKDKKGKENKYNELIPFIKMLKAKVAYAESREYVDEQFRQIFNKCIDQINSPETLRDAKLFMEAVMGYCKLYEANK